MSKTILIIDTDTTTRERLRCLLGAHGHAVDTVSTMAEALTAFERATWPLVLAPFALGDASGPALVRALQSLAPNTAVIGLGDQQQATALAALRGGAADYLPLPLDEGELVAALERARRNLVDRTPHQPPQGNGDQPASGAGQRQFITTLAHEINNPLTPIIGMAEMLLEDLPSDHPGQAYVRAIRTAAWRIRDVVRSLCEESEVGEEQGIADT